MTNAASVGGCAPPMPATPGHTPKKGSGKAPHAPSFPFPVADPALGANRGRADAASGPKCTKRTKPTDSPPSPDPPRRCCCTPSFDPLVSSPAPSSFSPYITFAAADTLSALQPAVTTPVDCCPPLTDAVYSCHSFFPICRTSSQPPPDKQLPHNTLATGDSPISRYATGQPSRLASVLVRQGVANGDQPSVSSSQDGRGRRRSRL